MERHTGKGLNGAGGTQLRRNATTQGKDETKQDRGLAKVCVWERSVLHEGRLYILV